MVLHFKLHNEIIIKYNTQISFRGRIYQQLFKLINNQHLPLASSCTSVLKS